jgi:ABC-type nitrate/sulfonate/bicarbonate transport system permease component
MAMTAMMGVAAIFAAGALGYGLNLLFLLIERRFVHWSGK